MPCVDTCCIPEHDYVDVLVLKKRWVQKSRKDHICTRCSSLIPLGTEYNYTTVLIDGEFRVDKTHVICPDEEMSYP